MDKNNKIEEIFENELSNNKYLRGHLPRLIESYNFIKKYLQDGQSIIDLGSYGHFTKIISKFHSIEFKISNFELRDNFPIESQSHDFVFCMEVIEHLKDRDSNNLEYISSFRYLGIFNLLCEMNRILKQDGLLFLTTPNINTYLSILRILNYENPYFFTPHPRELSINELKRFLKSTGFEIIEIDTKNVWNDYSIGADRYSDFVDKISNFCEKNGYSENLRGDDIFIIAKKVKSPEFSLYKNEYFEVTLNDIYTKQI